MTDINKVDRKKDRNTKRSEEQQEPDSETFREMMKIKKSGETDPEQKRGKKQAFEREEEIKAEQIAPKSKKKNVTDSIYDPPTQKANSTPPTSESFPEDPSSSPSTVDKPPTQQKSVVKKQKKKLSTSTATSSTTRKKKSTKKEGKKKVKPHAVEETSPPPLEGVKLPSQPIEEKKEDKEKSTAPTAEKKESLLIESPPTSPLADGAWEASEKKEKNSSSSEELVPAPLAKVDTPLATPAAPSTGSSITHPINRLPPQLAQLFEKLAGVMIVMNESGITQTTIQLDSAAYTHSALFGAEIVITEYATAPKEFNIELFGNEKANNLIASHSDEFLAAFEQGNYTFKVRRIEASHLSKLDEKRARTHKVKRKKKGQR